MGYRMDYPSFNVLWLTSLGRQAEALFSIEGGSELVFLSEHSGRISSMVGKAPYLSSLVFSHSVPQFPYLNRILALLHRLSALPSRFSVQALMCYLAFQVFEPGFLVVGVFT